MDAPISSWSGWSYTEAMGAFRSAFVVALSLTACSPPVLSIDAAVIDASVVDAAVVDASAPIDAFVAMDAGSGRFCAEVALTPWELTAGTWSHDYGPRGVSGSVLGLTTRGGVLYVAGGFTHAGPLPASNVARWTASEGWSALGGGVPSAAGTIAVAPDGTVYAADFNSNLVEMPALVRRFSGGVWTVIGTSDRDVEALAIDADGTLLVGGLFSFIDGAALPGLARWDGAWAPVAHDGFDVAAITVDEHGLCIGGRDLGATGYVECRGTSGDPWTRMPITTPPGRDNPNPVDAIVHDSLGRVVVGGALYYGTDVHIGGTLRWNGAAWDMLSPGLDQSSRGAEVTGLARGSADRIYAVGRIESIGRFGTSGNLGFHVARWGSERWDGFGGVQGNLTGGYERYAVVSDGTSLFVGGTIDEAFLWNSFHTHRLRGVARFDESEWSALAHPGANEHGPGVVGAITARGSCAPLIAGNFEFVEDARVARVARVEADASLTAVSAATGFDTYYEGPYALAIDDDGTIYAGGAGAIFDRLGVSITAPLARRTGGEWEPFGSFADPRARVTTLAIGVDGSLYVGGSFTNTVDAEQSHLMRWDGAVWSAVGARAERLPVTTMHVDGADLYVAETTSGGGARISRWNGSAWSVTGAPFATGAVRALATWHHQLVAAGTSLVGASAVAIYDGTTWNALLPLGGASTEVLAMAALGDELVVSAIDRPAISPYLFVRYTATGWSEVASIDGWVSALAFTADGLLVGGRFGVVDNTAAWGLALLRHP